MSVNITNFSCTKNGFYLSITNHEKCTFTARYLPKVPSKIEFDNLHSFANLIDEVKHGNISKLKVNFPHNEPDSHEYSIIISDSTGNYIEIIRQSETYLYRQFAFKKINGCNIAGRRNISLGLVGQVLTLPPRIFYGSLRKKLKLSFLRSISCYEEINYASRILDWLYKQKLNTGPVSKNHIRYKMASFEAKVKMLKNGEYAVQCGSFRDLFNHAATSQGLKVRSIGAVNYNPEFEGLSSYSHGLSELWVAKLDRFIIFDPWFCGLMVLDEGLPICYEQLMSKKDKEANLTTSFALDSMERFVVNGDGESNNYEFRSNELNLYSRSFIKALGGSMPPYLEYFKHISVQEVFLQNRFFFYLMISRNILSKIINFAK